MFREFANENTGLFFECIENSEQGTRQTCRKKNLPGSQSMGPLEVETLITMIDKPEAFREKRGTELRNRK